MTRTATQHTQHMTDSSEIGFVYVIEFVDKRDPSRLLGGRARYYVGWAKNVEARLRHHSKGKGARICAAAVEQGFSLRLRAVIPDMTRSDERAIKNLKSHARFVERLERTNSPHLLY